MKHTKGEWTAIKINDGYAIKEKSLRPGFSDRIAELYQYDAEANAAFIVKACNNFDSVLAALQAITTEYEYALNIIAEVGNFALPEKNNILTLSKKLIKKLNQK